MPRIRAPEVQGCGALKLPLSDADKGWNSLGRMRMQAEIGDRLILHTRRGTRIGVVVELTDGGSLVRWADGGENVLSTGTDAPEAHATWEAAKTATIERGWLRRGVTAGVGREAALRQEKLAREASPEVDEPVIQTPVAEAPAVEVPAEAVEAAAVETVDAIEAVEHRPAAGE